MGKVIKILFSVISTLILCMIILPLLMALLLAVPTIQNFAVQRLTDVANRKLGIEVSLDKISVKGYNMLTIDDLYLEDMKGDTMLYVPKLKANLNKAGIFKGDLMFGGVKLDSAKIYLNRPLGERPNVSQFIKHLKESLGEKEKKDKKGGVLLTDLELNNSHFKYFDERFEKVHDGINFRNMDFSDVAITIHQLAIAGDSVAMDLRELSFIDATGYGIDELSSDLFSFRKGSMYFRNLHVASTGSDLNLPQLDLLCNTWKSYRSFADSVRIEARVTNSHLEAQTLNCFVKSMKPGLDFVVDDLSMDVTGGVRDFTGNIYDATINEDILVSVDVAARNMTDKSRRRLDVTNLDLRTGLLSAEELYANLSDKGIKMSSKMRRRFVEMGRLHVTGQGRMRGESISVNAHMAGNIGQMELMGSLVDKGQNSPDSLGAKLVVRELQAGKITGAGVLGALTMNANVTGGVKDGRLFAYVNSDIDSFGFDSRTYSDISLNGRYEDKNVSFDLVSFDPKARMAMSGGVDFSEKGTPRYDFDMNAQRMKLHRLNVQPDSTAWLSLAAHGSGIGKDLDGLNGRVNIEDVEYVLESDTVRIGDINISALNGVEQKSLTLDSRLFSFDYRGGLNYKQAVQGVKERAYEFFPTLAPESYVMTGVGNDVPVTATLRFRDVNEFLAMAFDNVNVSDGTTLRVDLDNEKGELLSLSAPYADYKNIFVDDLRLKLTQDNDSLNVALQTRDFLLSNFHMPSLTVNGGADEDRFELTARFDDKENGTRANVEVNGSLMRDAEGLYLDLGVSPSYIDYDDRRWDLLAQQLVYRQSSILVDEMLLRNGSHYISADGLLTASETDTMSVRLHDIQLGVLQPLVDKLGYSVAGNINGYANLMALNNGIRLNAEAWIDSVKVNEYEVAPLKFESQWNTRQQRVVFTLKNEQNKKNLVRSFHRFDDKAFLTDVTLDNLPVNILAPIFKGELQDIDGSANVNLELRKNGPQSRLRINGDVSVDSLQTRLAYTGVEYKADRIDIGFDRSVATMESVLLTDNENNNARLNAHLDLRDFSDIKYDMKLVPENLTVLNMGATGERSFYGKVSVSGAVDVRGSNAGTSVTGAVSTGPNSLLNVSVGGAQDFYIADYVTFESPQDTVVVDTLESAFSRQREYKERVENEGRRGGLDVNMNLTVTPDLTFKLLIDPEYNNVLTANGNATLDVNVRPRDDLFSIYGLYEISSGNYNFNIQNLIEKNFTLSSGSSITWTGDPADATLDITASYRLRTSIASLVGTMGRVGNTTANVDCVVNITDRLTSPQFSFDVQLPDADSEYQAIISSSFSTQEMMATQFFYLLAFGSLYSDTNYAENLNVGASAGTSLGFDFLTSQIRNILSADDMNFNLRYTPKSTVNSDEYGFYFQNDLINDKLVLELEGNYDTGNNPTSSTNRVSGGGTLTYYIDSSGNLVLKGYSRTIDRFDENQGLQENGVGIYFKEDFNNMKDLADRLKRRFAKKNKKQNKKN
ncbi:MAG: translocation/assembly module TamB domain-containing protein [Tidjanibacter sp.]|nr:translocation/assembly module TamB domain-containing protein [Tidjanibacter sp.]